MPPEPPPDMPAHAGSASGRHGPGKAARHGEASPRRAVVERALGALPGPERHLHRLAEAALRLTREGEPLAAFLLADRLCRVLHPVNADALALRGTIAQVLGDTELMRSDMMAAVALTPAHGVANLLALRFGTAPEKQAAAMRLLEPRLDAPHLGFAVETLIGSGAPLVAVLAATEREVTGWAVWPAGIGALLHIDWTAQEPDAGAGARLPGSTTLSLFADPGHPLARSGHCAASIHLPWPDQAAGCLAQALPDRAVPAAAEGEASADDDDPADDQPAAILKGGALVRPQPRPSRGSHGARAALQAPARPARIAVIVPLHGDADSTLACLSMLREGGRPSVPQRLIVVDDASPDPRIRAIVDELAATGGAECVRNEVNLGFAASINRGLARLMPEEDALLLNADAFLPPGALDRLCHAAYAADDVGTVTPLSNNGEYTSVPLRFRDNPLPAADRIRALDAAAARANRGLAVAIPNGIGFCLYVRRDALAAAGGRLSLEFGRGYYEDVDFCLRLAQAGFRNVCAADVYVGHAGARSFGAAKRALVLDNLAKLNARHPAYQRASAAFVRDDPLAEAAERFRAVALAAGPAFRLAIVAGERPAPPGLLPRQDGAGPAVELASVRIADGALELAIRDSPHAEAAGLVLGHDLPDAVSGLAADLQALPLDALTLVDPHLMPKAALDAVLASGIAFEVMATEPGLACANLGLMRRREQRHACCNGLCPVEFEQGRDGLAACGRQPKLLPRAARISAATPELAQWLRGMLPEELGARVEALQGAAEQASALPPLASRLQTPPRLVLVANGPGREASIAAAAIVAGVRTALGEVEAVMLGEADGDLALAAGSGIFVTGPIEHSEIAAWLARLGPGHVLFMARQGLMGDARRLVLAGLLDRAGWPVAAFRWPGEAGAPGPNGLGLRADARTREVASTLARWMAGSQQRLEREQRAGIEPEALHREVRR